VKRLIESGKSRGFSLFFESGLHAPLKSTFPPDTLLAWPSIYTGLLPYRFNLQPEPENPIALRFESLRIRNELIGKTFWDIASENNRKACIVNPIFAYPPWRVNGIMVSGPSFGLKGPTLSEPPRSDVFFYQIGTYGSTPLLPHEYHETYSEALEQSKKVFHLTYKLFNEDSYDLMFVADYTLDRIEHYYWRFSDPEDPLYPKLINSFKNAIIDYYKYLDSILYLFLKKFSNEYTVVVLGDHGHARRPIKLISIDKILNPNSKNTYSPIEVLRHLGMLFTHCAGVDNVLYWFIKRVQEKGLIGRILLKEREKPEEDSNPSHLCRIKSIKEFGLKEYIGLKLEIRERICYNFLLKAAKILITGGLTEEYNTPIEYYEPRYSYVYPADLFVKLRDYGNLQTDKSFLLLPNFTRRIISGGHGPHSLFLIHEPNRKARLKSLIIKVQDIAPSVLYIMGLKSKHRFDGVNVISYE
jgi:predicted AlkP superfamily phosphohydrolase/phosphomutase